MKTLRFSLIICFVCLSCGTAKDGSAPSDNYDGADMESSKDDSSEIDLKQEIECQVDQDCDDQDPCTLNICFEQSKCIFPAIEDCCYEGDVRDCGIDVGECQLGTQKCQKDNTWGDCEGAIFPIEESCNDLDDDCDGLIDNDCCENDSDCDDGNPCSIAQCIDKNCQYMFLSDCCEDDDQCHDHNICTQDSCINKNCMNKDIAGCCLYDYDCDDDNACTTNTCIENKCVYVTLDNCCNQDQDCQASEESFCHCVDKTTVGCGQQTDKCDMETHVCIINYDSYESCKVECVNASCVCSGNENCYDGKNCTADLCKNGVCHYEPIADCCEEDHECFDDDECTFDKCVNNKCQTSALCVSDCLNGDCLCSEESDCPQEDKYFCEDYMNSTGIIFTGKCVNNKCEKIIIEKSCQMNCNGDDGRCHCQVTSHCDEGEICISGTCYPENQKIYFWPVFEKTLAFFIDKKSIF